MMEKIEAHILAAVRPCSVTVRLRRQHVMAQESQLFHDGEEEILIRIEQHWASLRRVRLGLFIRADGGINLFAVGSGVFPGRFEVG